MSTDAEVPAATDGAPSDVDKAELWGVMMDGRLGNQVFPTAQAAMTVAVGLRQAHGASVVEVARLDVVILSRVRLPRMIAVPGKDSR